MAVQNLTMIGSAVVANGTTVSVWILPAPVAGAGTITVNNSSSVSTNYYAQLWSGMSQVSSADSVGSIASISSSTLQLNASTTTVANNSIAILSENASRGDDMPGTGTQFNGSQFPANNANAGGGSMRLWSGTTLKTPAGSTTLQATNTASRTASAQTFSLAPNGTPTYNSEYTCPTPSSTMSFAGSATLSSVTNGMLIIQVATAGGSLATTSVTWNGPAVSNGNFLAFM